jgi:hypothetical protein
MEEYTSLSLLLNDWSLTRQHKYNGSMIKRYFNDTKTGYYRDGVTILFAEVYDVLYKTLYDELPVKIGISLLLDKVIKWRLDLGK